MDTKVKKNGDLYNMTSVLDRCLELKPARLVVARPYDRATLKSVSIAVEKGIVQSLLVGRALKIKERAEAEQLSLNTDGCTIIDTDEEAILEQSAALVHNGEADFIMKGLVGTGNFIHVLFDPKWKLRTENILSHVSMLEIPETKRIFLMSDAAINILPNFSRKIQIVLNAVNAGRELGIRDIRVAMLAAVEKVKLPAMPATLDAFLMKKYSTTGIFGKCEIDGPFAFDNAIDPQKAGEKEIGGRVAGRANILIVPNIETGNVIWKYITCLQRGFVAGVVLGGKCPIVVPSRSDDFQTKLLSIKLSRLLLNE